MSSIAVVILAAGKGTRMKSDRVKVLHPLAGLPMLAYPLDVARSLRPERLIVVVGFQGDLVREKLRSDDVIFADQEKQLGTGHAVQMARPHLLGFQGTVLILSGDVPLLKAETIKKFLAHHASHRCALSVLTAVLEDPKGYGRVFRDSEGALLRIVEDRDLRPGEEKIPEINTGIYLAETDFLLPALEDLRNENAQKEYYLTDIVSKASSQKRSVFPFLAEDPSEVMGINTRAELAKAARLLRERISGEHMIAGVTLIDPETAYIDRLVKIGRDSIIYPNCYLLGRTLLGAACVVEPGCKINDAQLGNSVCVKASSVIAQSVLEDRVEVGPFAHVRQQTILREGSRIGNFVEVKKSVVGRGSQANHLSYLGDASLGEKVNVGAGTVTCNFDGEKKHPTVIGDGVFLGSNTALVAPVKVERNAVVGAGSTITKQVPPDTLAVARGKQRHYKKRAKLDG